MMGFMLNAILSAMTFSRIKEIILFDTIVLYIFDSFYQINLRDLHPPPFAVLN